MKQLILYIYSGIFSEIQNNCLVYQWENLNIQIAENESVFKSRYQNLLSDWNPDWVWMHNPYFSDIDIELCFPDSSQRYCFFIRSDQGMEWMGKYQERYQLAIANSDYLRKRAKGKWPVASDVVYSVPSLDTIKSDEPLSHRQYITMINPVKSKGGEITKALIEYFPQRYFMLVEGWIDPEIEGLSFKGYDNVCYLKPTLDMKSVYGYSRVLLVPSLWEENLPRIIFEANINGVPVIVSDQGGVREAMNGNGILISDYTEFDQWIEAIESLDSPETYEKCVNQSKKMAEKFSIDREVEKLESVLLTEMESE